MEEEGELRFLEPPGTVQPKIPVDICSQVLDGSDKTRIRIKSIKSTLGTR